ncbi:sensor histidine kinase [Flavobacterium sp. T12S277]|uniref:sensor histidine kinase n=1 Tax=Flavobacterium sp. T12S277 TaxID=3402752 RepID=UPI003AE06FFD
MEKLKFEQRKIVHYSLLLCVIFLQIIVAILWYKDAETYKSFDDVSCTREISRLVNKLSNSFITSQGEFNNYIKSKNGDSLKKYFQSLNEMNLVIDSLSSSMEYNEKFKKLAGEKHKIEENVFVLKYIIQSILEKRTNSNLNDISDHLNLKKIKFRSILDDIEINSGIQKDSVPRKGLFSRLGNAILGKQDIQKEWSNVIVTIRYKDEVISGSIEEQLVDIVKKTNKYYENELFKLKQSFLNLRNQDLKLMELNGELLSLSKKILSDYNTSLNTLQADRQKRLKDQYDLNKMTKNYVIVILIVVMLIISVILLNFTRLAFEYERRLTIAQAQIHQSLNFKNRIMGMISHEIRSPLSIISIYVKLVSESVKDVDIIKNFKSIEFTTNSLLLLSNQILEYSRNEEHKFELKCKKIELKKEIYQIISSMSSLVQCKGNRIEVKANLIPECNVCSDVAKIYQLFYNIIGNANKHTQNGLILIGIDLEAISEFKINLKIEVQDSGIGISENDLRYVFESYYQGSISGEVQDLGVGLGLNICKEIVELFEGHITIESKNGDGTKVIFNLILSKI